MFCRKCGSELPNDSLFCLKCGEKVITSPYEQNTLPSVEDNFSYKQHFLTLLKFSGTVSRKSFIKNILIVFVVQLILWFIAISADGGLFSILALLVILCTAIPILSLTVRRVRDAGCAVVLVPIFIALTVFFPVNTTYYLDKMTDTYRQAEIARNPKYERSPNAPAKGFDLEGFIRHSEQLKEGDKESKRLRKEAAGYSRLSYNYRIAAIGLPIIFYGVFSVLPSRKRRELSKNPL